MRIREILYGSLPLVMNVLTLVFIVLNSFELFSKQVVLPIILTLSIITAIAYGALMTENTRNIALGTIILFILIFILHFAQFIRVMEGPT